MEKRLSFGERLVKRLGGVTRAELDMVRNRAFEAGMEAASAADGNDETPLYLGGAVIGRGYSALRDTPRDLSAWSQERAIEAAFRLWQTNPLAKTLTEIVVDYVLGDKVQVQAHNPEVQAVLDRFLGDPVNELVDADGTVLQGLDSLARELGLFGESLVLLFPRDGADMGVVGDGRLRIGTVDPSLIHSVICDKNNRRHILAVKLKDKQGGDQGPVYRVVQQEMANGMLEGVRDLRAYYDRVRNGRISEGEGQADFVKRLRDGTVRLLRGVEWVVDGDGQGQVQFREAEEGGPVKAFEQAGECMLFQVNRISTGVRGRPDMLPLIDWLDRFDQVFFDGAEHAALLNMFAWDLRVEGGSETAPEPERNLTIQAQRVAKLKPGSVYGHNEMVELTAKNPDLKTQDLETLVRQLRVLLASGSRMPEHWLGEGGYTNRATAAEMGLPTFRMLSRRQAVVRGMLTRLCQYAIDTAVALGLLPEMVDVLDEEGESKGDQTPAREAFEVQMQDINVEDTGMAARTLASVAQAILPLTASGFLPEKPAMEMLAAAASLLGVEIEVDKVLEERDELRGLPGKLRAELQALIGKMGNTDVDEEEEDPSADFAD